MTLFWPAFLTLIAVQCALAITCAPWIDLIDGNPNTKAED